ncbi:ATP-dependent helicase HrpB [Marinomonas epiphytica]
MSADSLSSLPITSLIPDLLMQLRRYDEALLEAAPGAGKTTAIPLALLGEDWLKGRKIIVLEPRRLAAKSAAQRLADNLGEPLGQQVGFRIRHENKESKETKILVVTEGVLTRMLQDDPSLEDVALVIFDEFHERNLHSDLALALCLQARELYRDETPLKLLIMSATLDTQELSQKLACTHLKSDGRSHPVELIYSNKTLKTADVVNEVIALTRRALHEQSGSILVFLPGQKEIRYVQQQLTDQLNGQDAIHILPLYGELSLKEQEQVIRPAAPNERKVVLATAIAQTSLTIDGIRVVIDSGLSREAQFDAKTATTRLVTRKATQAETTQRMGRAGRTQAGICYRWWSENAQQLLAQQAQPQIECVDLSHLVLNLAQWGVQDRLELNWVTPPPFAHFEQAVDLLRALNALQPADLALTRQGEQMTKLNLDPRLAKLMIIGKSFGQAALASQTCALLSEGDPLRHSDSSMEQRLNWLAGSQNKETARPKFLYEKSAQQWLTRVENLAIEPVLDPPSKHATLGILLAAAYSDRIAKRLDPSGSPEKVRYKLANGRIATLNNGDPNAQYEYLVAPQISGFKGQQEDRIHLAQALDMGLIKEYLGHLITQQNRVLWSKEQARLISLEQSFIGKLCIAQKPTKKLNEAQISQTVIEHIRQQGLNCLPWDDHSKQLIARVGFAQKFDSNHWPDWSHTELLRQLEDWLAPYLSKVTTQAALDKLDMYSILLNSLSWELQSRLQQFIPERLAVASGHQHKVDYQKEPPVLSVKLQEVFGMTQTPQILGQNVSLELLSPAQRPLAITRDLPFFWQETYPSIKKEMRGRYVKHPWPDDPLSALATAKTNRALRS